MNTNKTQSHTPGPWTRITCHYRDYRTVIEIDQQTETDSRTIATLETSSTPDPVMQANARLIAAAPDLLSELKNIVASNMGHPGGVTVSALDPARATIAKAEGKARE